MQKEKAPLNRTITITDAEKDRLQNCLITVNETSSLNEILNRVICQDFFNAVDFLPDQCVDLMIADPPYNLQKTYSETVFKAMKDDDYYGYTESWISKIYRLLKPDASVYICCDWKSSNAIFSAASKYFSVRNRITWEREKGKGAKLNWKNCSEDIWYFTKGSSFTFNLENVKLKRKVLAPYKTSEGVPKDWIQESDGNYRITHPSNFWSDITVPFWSMPENTEHPTQKPEKLLAKLILASSNENDIVFDPFAGSGSTAVTAKKLNRNFIAIEKEPEYACYAQKRILLADEDKSIQGFDGRVFFERNSNKKL